MANLKFTCPKCGKHELGSVEENIMTYPITRLDAEGNFEYDYDNPTVGDGQVLSYQCMNCGYELKDENGLEIQNCVSAAEWLIAHQEASNNEYSD